MSLNIGAIHPDIGAIHPASIPTPLSRPLTSAGPNKPESSWMWKTIKNVAKVALYVFASLAITSFYAFNTNILFIGAFIGMTSSKDDWLRKRVEKFEDTVLSHLPACILATILFLSSTPITYSFVLGAYIGIDMAKLHESYKEEREAAAASTRQ